MEVNSGDVFKTFNDDMTPPKPKFHLCINKNRFFIINSEPRKNSCNFKLSKNDCKILTKECYIDYGRPFCRSIEDFNIIQVSELSKTALKGLIEYIKLAPTLTPILIKEILKDLENVL